jgi:cyclophilin family peptidyl-prolyl cis-trans isomerase
MILNWQILVASVATLHFTNYSDAFPVWSVTAGAQNDHTSFTSWLPATKMFASASPYLSAERIFFDIAVDGREIGKLIFSLTIPSSLPAHAQNVVDLCQSRHYVGSEFDYGADYVESEARYRWCHILRGRPVSKTITDPENQRNSKHSVFGGTYYGDVYKNQRVVLAVAVEGPGRGAARFSIVRIAESPQEWGESLLLNSGVIGELVDGIDVLQFMAQQKKGPPKVTGCGIL